MRIGTYILSPFRLLMLLVMIGPLLTGAPEPDPSVCTPNPCGQRGECVPVPVSVTFPDGLECTCATGASGERCTDGLSNGRGNGWWLILLLTLIGLFCSCNRPWERVVCRPRYAFQMHQQLLMITATGTGCAIALICVRKRSSREAEQSAIDAQSLILGSTRGGTTSWLPSPSATADSGLTVGATQPIM